MSKYVFFYISEYSKVSLLRWPNIKTSQLQMTQY